MSEWVSLTLKVDERLRANPAPFEITIGDQKRNNDQNALFHAVCQQAADKYNASPTAIKNTTAGLWKATFKEKLGKKIVYFDIEENPIVEVVSTTKYTKPEMALFVDKIIAFCDTQYGISLEIKSGEL